MVKKLLNKSETITHSRLRRTCERNGASVNPKVRLADVLPIEHSGISDEDYRFALQSHFDFVVTDAQFNPLFAVEFDGPLHKASEDQKRRDAGKDWLCERFEFPFLRINSEYLQENYRNMDVLSWFVEVWFLQESFYKAQAEVDPVDAELFDAWSFARVGGLEGDFPLWFAAEAQVEIKKLHKSGQCLDDVPTVFVGFDEAGDFYAIACLRLDAQSCVYVEIAMRGQKFPVIQSEIVEQVAVCELYEAITTTLKDKSKAHPLRDGYEQLKTYQQCYKLAVATSGGGWAPTNYKY